MLNPLVKPYYFKIRPGVIFAEERLEEEEDGRVEDVLVVLHVHRSRTSGQLVRCAYKNSISSLRY